MSVRENLLSTTMLAGIVGGVFLTVQVVRAADLNPNPVFKATPAWLEPAVDGFNAKWDALAGTLAHRSLFGSRGAFSTPLGPEWGLQIDYQAGSLEQRAYGSLAGHLFTRRPSQGLLGLYGSYTRWDQFGGVYVSQLAAEAAFYFGRFTVEGIAGVESGNKVSVTTAATNIIPPAFPLPGIVNVNSFTQGFDVDTRFFDQINFKYYFGDNFAGYVGHRYLGGKNALAVGAEAALGLGRGVMASAFLEGRIGEQQFEGVWGGVRFYFGQKDKTLIRRHREDDPPIWDTLHSLTNNYFSTGSSSSTAFCPPGSFMQPDGTCEAGSFGRPR